MPAPQIVHELVELFERNREEYTSGGYNETQLRHQFLDPLFEALGWDINNRDGNAESYKDVIHEDSILVGDKPLRKGFGLRLRLGLGLNCLARGFVFWRGRPTPFTLTILVSAGVCACAGTRAAIGFGPIPAIGSPPSLSGTALNFICGFRADLTSANLCLNLK